MRFVLLNVINLPQTNPINQMKKFILSSALAILVFAANSQSFSDNFDNYSSGAYLAQSNNKWTTWGNQAGTSQDVQVSTAKAHSGSNSLYFASSAQNGGPVDEVLPFGGVYNTGTFVFEMSMFVDNGKVGYFNFQSKTPVGTEWAMDCNFKNDGTFEILNTTDGTLLKGTYSQNKWFNIKMNINLNSNVWDFMLDNTSQGTFTNTNNQLASLDLFAMNGSSFYIDDVKYDYTPYTLTTTNCATTNIGNVVGYLAGQSVTPTVTLRNMGTTTITKCDVKLTYNGTTITKNLTGLSVASLATYTATMPSPITLVAGANNIVATVSNVNGNATDGDANDDVKTISLSPVVPAANKIVVAEEATGTWCGWCVRGAVYLKTLTDKYGVLFQGIAVHNADPMVVTDYDAAMKTKVSGYPSAMIDRGAVKDPSAIEPDFLQRVLVAPKATITNGATYTASTNTLKVSLSTNFLQAATGDYRISCVIVEDGVTGTGSGYDQHNYYAGGGSGVMGGYETKTNPVPASQMVYDHVARTISPSFTGLANSYPSSISQGFKYTHNFTFTLDPSWNTTNMHIVGLLIDPNGKIDNASSTNITTAVANGFVNGTSVTSVNTLDAPDGKLKIYPNPSSGNSTIELVLNETSNTSLQVFASDGKLVMSKTFNQMPNGAYTFPLATDSWENGVYLIKVDFGSQSITRRFIKF